MPPSTACKLQSCSPPPPYNDSMIAVLSHVLLQLFAMLRTVQIYFGGLWYYAAGKGTTLPYETDLYADSVFAPLRATKADSAADLLWKQRARVHLYHIAAHFFLWDEAHYRKGCFATDLRDNLRNVAIPRTGVPLSIFAWNRATALLFLIVIYPLIALCASLQKWLSSRSTSAKRSWDLTPMAEEFRTRLLAPDDWFNFWRLNCTIVGLHSLLNEMPSDYKMENKWEFLQTGKARGVAVSPFLDDLSAVVVKHRNEEGGMGIHIFDSAAHGGDWIIQRRLRNSAWVRQCLPSGAPLSTFRVITVSHFAAKAAWREGTEAWRDAEGAEAKRSDIEALSCVFRAGRAGAPTDHGAILFDVDTETGKVGGGTTNAHWYQLGAAKASRCAWRSFHGEYEAHCDDASKRVTGRTVPDIKAMLSLAEESHLKLCAKVPLCGWDVALTEDGLCLLEVNLSCNFFRGSFDLRKYLNFCDTALSAIHANRLSTKRS